MLIENELRSQKELHTRLESTKRGYNKEKEAIFVASIPNWLPKHSVHIPLLFNREYMQQMAQRLALIKSMRREEEMQSVVV